MLFSFQLSLFIDGSVFNSFLRKTAEPIIEVISSIENRHNTKYKPKHYELTPSMQIGVIREHTVIVCGWVYVCFHCKLFNVKKLRNPNSTILLRFILSVKNNLLLFLFICFWWHSVNGWICGGYCDLVFMWWIFKIQFHK